VVCAKDFHALPRLCRTIFIDDFMKSLKHYVVLLESDLDFQLTVSIASE
jgi:hypothetical protein